MDKCLHNVSSYSIQSSQVMSFDLCISMSGYSGHERVAFRAVCDVRKKDYLRRISQSDAEFKRLWGIECRKKQQKLKAMEEGTWRTKLNRVSYGFEPKQAKSIKIGRFLVTTW